MMKKKTVSEKEVMDVLFIEFELVRERVEIHGNAKGHTFSPLVVRFAMMLRSKMTKSNYEFVKEVVRHTDKLHAHEVWQRRHN